MQASRGTEQLSWCEFASPTAPIQSAALLPPSVFILPQFSPDARWSGLIHCPSNLPPPSPPPRLTENGASLCFYSSSGPPLKSNARLLSCYLVISLYSPTRCHATPTGVQQTPKALPLIHGTAADNDSRREERVGG